MEQTREISTSKNVGDSIVRWLPFIPGILIFFSMARLISYYSIFNVNVLEYITIRDALMLSLDKIIVLVTFIFVSFGFIPKPVGWQAKQSGEDKQTDVKSSGKRISNNKKIYVQLLVLIASTLSGVLGIVEIVRPLIKPELRIWVIPFSVYIILIISILIALSSIARTLQQPVDQRFVNFYLKWMAIVSLLLGLLGGWEGARIKFGGHSPEVEFIDKNNGNDIMLNKYMVQMPEGEAKFLGRLQDFTFVYWTLSEQVEVISNDNIKGYTIKTSVAD